jgi:hypothetical protein
MDKILCCVACQQTGCALNCVYCEPGRHHKCRSCGNNNSTHRSSHCKANITPKSCIFNCGSCEPGNQHTCRNCKAKNDHRTIDCPYEISYCSHYCHLIAMRRKCIFVDCHSCKPGFPHRCRNCKAVNHHRTKDCPKKKSDILSLIESNLEP